MIDLEFIKKLEALGVDKVRENLLLHKYSDLSKKTAENWLHGQDNKKEDEYNKKHLIIIEEANQKAEEANLISRSSKTAAWWALGVSILSLLISTIILLFKLF